MSDEFLENKMLLFLERNYPVSRIKQNMRFRRGIVLDDGEAYFLGDWASQLNLQVKLDDILETVFNSDEKTNLDVLKKFLHLTK